MNSIFLGNLRYVLAAPGDGEGEISVLEKARDQYRKQFEEAHALAVKDPQSELNLKNLSYYSRAYKAYSRLIIQLQKKPDLLPEVTKIVNSTPSPDALISKLEEMGFKLNTHLPGEGVYQDPSQQEKTVPMFPQPTPPNTAKKH